MRLMSNNQWKCDKNREAWIERGEDCSAVLVQLSAVISALNSTGRVILKDHIAHCIVDAVEDGDTAAIDSLNDAIDRFMR